VPQRGLQRHATNRGNHQIAYTPSGCGTAANEPHRREAQRNLKSAHHRRDLVHLLQGPRRAPGIVVQRRVARLINGRRVSGNKLEIELAQVGLVQLFR
jgi:hypothetical protein